MVSRVGVGTAPFGNLFGYVSDQEATAVLRLARDRGVVYLDTAPNYGAGLAEVRIGSALAELGRGGFVISTKTGRLLEPVQPTEESGHPAPGLRSLRTPGERQRSAPGSSQSDRADASAVGWRGGLQAKLDFSYEGTRRSISESMERLGVQAVDVAYVHEPEARFESDLNRHVFPALEESRAAGEIAAIGLGHDDVGLLTRVARTADVDCLLVAGRYTLLNQEALGELLPVCLKRRISVVLGGIYNSGVLANPDRGFGVWYDYAPASREVLGIVARIREVCNRYAVPLSAAAIQFPFGHEAVSSVLVGVRSAAELEENLEMLRIPIPSEVWKELKKHKLIPDEAPVPCH
jgi:D-threo-aldose 1-dehydrogenase